MAKILLGAGIVGISGKIAGHSYQRIKAGHINRRKGLPVQHTQHSYAQLHFPGQDNVQANKAHFQALSQHWKELSEAERASWRNNSFNGKTGYHLYMLYNRRRVTAGIAWQYFPGQPKPLPVLSNWQFSSNPIGTFYEVRVTAAQVMANTGIWLFTTPPCSAGRTSWRNGYTLAAGFNVTADGVAQGSLSNEIPVTAPLEGRLLYCQQITDLGFSYRPPIRITAYTRF